MHRSRMTARVVPLTSPEASDPRTGGTLQERLNAVEELTIAAWRLAGRSFPVYSRSAMPIVVGTLKDHADSV